MKNFLEKNKNISRLFDGNKKNRGFTILETLVAIFILVLSITGPMVFAQNSLKSAFISRDQITAFYLAQDAIEYIKNIRENNFLADGYTGGNWLDVNIFSACSVDTESKGCSIDTIRGSFETCDGGVGCTLGNPLKIGTDGSFNIDSGSDSNFSRKIFLDEVQPDKELQINVEVEFNTNSGQTRKIEVQENIFNWRNSSYQAPSSP